MAKREVGKKKSPGPRLIAALTDLRNRLRDGRGLKGLRVTRRTRTKGGAGR